MQQTLSHAYLCTVVPIFNPNLAKVVTGQGQVYQ